MRRVLAAASIFAIEAGVGLEVGLESVCPQANAGETRYGSHAIPKQVFYTGKTDANLQNLTWGERGAWPSDYAYNFYDNDGLDESMRGLAVLLHDEVPGVYAAFSLLRPWAYKADLWRYCILYVCGGIYVDSKLALAEPLGDFLWNAGFNPHSLSTDHEPQLYSCRDDLASESMHPKLRVTCFWQGLLVAEPGNPGLLKTIKFVVKRIQRRWYPPYELSKMPWLFLTGPGAIALATQTNDPGWRDSIKLRCRMTYTSKTAVKEPLKNPHLVGDWHLRPGDNHSVYDDDMTRASFIADAGLHETQRTNSYGKLFKSHLVYMDDDYPASPNASKDDGSTTRRKRLTHRQARALTQSPGVERGHGAR